MPSNRLLKVTGPAPEATRVVVLAAKRLPRSARASGTVAAPRSEPARDAVSSAPAAFRGSIPSAEAQAARQLYGGLVLPRSPCRHPYRKLPELPWALRSRRPVEQPSSRLWCRRRTWLAYRRSGLGSAAEAAEVLHQALRQSLQPVSQRYT